MEFAKSFIIPRLADTSQLPVKNSSDSRPPSKQAVAVPSLASVTQVVRTTRHQLPHYWHTAALAPWNQLTLVLVYVTRHGLGTGIELRLCSLISFNMRARMSGRALYFRVFLKAYCSSSNRGEQAIRTCKLPSFVLTKQPKLSRFLHLSMNDQ